MVTWRGKITRLMPVGETLITVAPDESVLDVEFDDGYGLAEGPNFTAWSQSRVFFPVVYDGAEAVGSVPRDPCDEESEHFGGG
jgi:hypothetical protein